MAMVVGPVPLAIAFRHHFAGHEPRIGFSGLAERIGRVMNSEYRIAMASARHS